MVKIDPSELCPCGSGMEFAKCHGLGLRATEPTVRTRVSLQTVPEPAPGTASVFEKIGNGTRFIQGTESDISYDCGACGASLMAGVLPGQVSALMLRCASCGTYNLSDYPHGAQVRSETPPPISENQLRDRVVRLVDLAVVDDVIRGLRFTNCLVVGPAVIVPLGATSFVNSGFDGDQDSLLWELSPQRQSILGAIGVEDCSFAGCRFTRIGLAGPPELVSRLRSTLNDRNDAAPAATPSSKEETERSSRDAEAG